LAARRDRGLNLGDLGRRLPDRDHDRAGVVKAERDLSADATRTTDDKGYLPVERKPLRVLHHQPSKLVYANL
jgi:hypothetical protein